MSTTTTTDPTPTTRGTNAELLARYQRAWSEGDVEGIVSMMTDDGVYEASFGPDPWGERFVGPDAIRAGILRNRAASSHRDSTHEYVETHLFGDIAVARWESTWTDADGSPGAVHGMDLFEFRNGRVARKIAYRKGRAG
jgi:ketosteroid isomerase-like protein